MTLSNRNLKTVHTLGPTVIRGIFNLPMEGDLRERERFGIPSSLSYGAREEHIDHVPPARNVSKERKAGVRFKEPEQNPGLPHLDSEASSVGGNWRGSGDGSRWTTGAEALIRQISSNAAYGEPERLGGRRQPYNDYRSDAREWERDDQRISRSRESGQPVRPPSLISASSSAPSIYDTAPLQQDIARPSPENTVGRGQEQDPDSWRATMSQSTYKVFLQDYSEKEVERQDLIHRLSNSEEDFVVRLRFVIGLFVLPLRQKDSRRWLPGIPARISRLFDWLDDIMSLHASIASTLRSLRRVWKTGGVILRLADALRGFIPRLEIYQPYLARVDDAKSLVDACINDPNDEFGEYIRIRECESGIQGFSLFRFLDEPIIQITGYPDLFLVSTSIAMRSMS